MAVIASVSGELPIGRLTDGVPSIRLCPVVRSTPKPSYTERTDGSSASPAVVWKALSLHGTSASKSRMIAYHAGALSRGIDSRMKRPELLFRLPPTLPTFGPRSKKTASAFWAAVHVSMPPSQPNAT
ncbi:hypothetical protein USDA257_p03630 (plasmid) [Sinorhizobium fredii USDA 257]|uniref:Uncharacterized protein n=1 Tax=Sinorhizobium fredii (strain USDA 257) TaxID=1185652 RepID=I3XGS2_SINF2|nr:hypothetical protein USDA257_p03630 [Sinorhizobium fredii USDA 257]